MDYWEYFPAYALIATVFWMICLLLQLSKNSKINNAGVIIAASIGTLCIFAFVIQLWLHLERPPMRTLGETRLWYSAFLPVVGIASFVRWRYKWLLDYSLLMAILFLFINWLNPDTYSKTLMPALQSIWFVPHVLVYIFGYALLAVSCIIAIWGLFQLYRGRFKDVYLRVANNLVYIGVGFLTLGLLFGALWAKEAWGHYWTWDPKETWALLTWLAYLLYIHIRYRQPDKQKTALLMLAFAFIILMVCWFGINYLPSAQQSVHTYSN